jgi:hypothetical protein
MMASLIRRGCLGAAAFLLMAGVAPAALAEPGPAVSALNPNRPAPDGFLAPTLAGDWRFRIAAAPWMPNVAEITASTAAGGGSVRNDLAWLLKSMYFYLPLDFEVRKGNFGLLYKNFLIFLQPNEPVEIIGPITLDFDMKLMMFDVGITYDVGRWRLWDSPNAFELTLEPYFGVRIIHIPIDITVLGSSVDEDLGSQVPVLGLRAFIDLTKSWNLEFIGDYGGWGVDNNHQTWQGAAYLGYRWPGLGAHWNLQAGYRAMRFFEMRQEATDIALDVRGAQITFGVEF